MAINLLLDTSILRRLLNVLEDDWNLHKLKVWLDLGELRLYVPEAILEEWERRKKEKLQEITTDVNRIKKEQKIKRGFPGIDATPEEIRIATLRIKHQIEIIDNWLRTSTTYPEGPAAMAAREQQRAAAEPPFQGGKESDNDAIIIFSTLETLAAAKEQDLFFVSSNTNDFCEWQADLYNIHPTIQARFPTVFIHFYESLNKFVDDAVANGRLSRRPDTVSDKTGLLENFPIDQSLHPIDQLYFYLTARFRTINFLPRSLYAAHFPIAINTTRNLFDRPFTLSTNNVELYNSLKSVTINNGQPENLSIDVINQVENHTEKILTIFRTLTFNFSYHLSWQYHSPDPLPMIETDTSNALITQYRELKFATLWSKIVMNDTDSLSTLMEKGYVSYKLGSYGNAARIYQKARDLAERENNHDAAFFATYSLSKLGQFINSYVFDKLPHQKLQEELDSIDLEGATNTYTTRQNKDILSWMTHNRFISEGVAALSEAVSNIARLEHARSGGRNNNFISILNTYFEIDYFLLFNSIVFDKFNEYTILTDAFLSGVFASYASNQRIQGQIEVFPEWLLETIMVNAKAESLKYYVSRYNINAIDYKVEKIDYFQAILLPFLTNYIELYTGTTQLDADTAKSFRDHLSDLLTNAVVLVAITNLAEDLQNQLLTAIHAILDKWGTNLSPALLDHLNFIFYKKNDQLSPSWAQKFLITYIQTKCSTNDSPFLNLIHILSKNNQALPLSDEEFTAFEKNWLILEHGGLTHADIVFQITSILQSREQRATVAAFISRTLDAHFNSSLLYQADFHQLIHPTDEQLRLFEEQLINRLFPAPPTTALRQPPLRFPYALSVDQYIHYCAQHQHQMPAKLLTGILDVDPYYTWILDPDKFDYAQFSTIWLNHGLTKALKATLKQCSPLKEYLEKQLNHRRDSDTLWAYYQLFHT